MRPRENIPAASVSHAPDARQTGDLRDGNAKLADGTTTAGQALP